MIIQTPERRYAVLRILRSSDADEISVCQAMDGEGEISVLACFRNAELNRSLLPMLTQQRENPDFEDFLELFSRDGALYARFRYTDAPLLCDELREQAFNFRERLDIAGDLLERMTLLNMPEPIQFEALRDQNITVDRALRVRFNYILESMFACYNVDMGFICLRVEELLRAIFAPELAIRGVPELDAYLQKLQLADCTSYLEIYKGYDQVRKVLLGRTMEGPVKPRTWLFRLWDRIKSLKRFVKPVLGGLVLIAAFCYLLYSLLIPRLPKGTPVIFDRIGTVEITSGVHVPEEENEGEMTHAADQ